MYKKLVVHLSRCAQVTLCLKTNKQNLHNENESNSSILRMLVFSYPFDNGSRNQFIILNSRIQNNTAKDDYKH